MKYNKRWKTTQYGADYLKQMEIIACFCQWKKLPKIKKYSKIITFTYLGSKIIPCPMFARKWQSDQLQRIIVVGSMKRTIFARRNFFVAVYWDLVYHLTIRGTLWNILPLLSSLWKFSWISSFLYALGYRDGDYTSQRRRIYDYNLRNGKLFSVISPCLVIRGFDILLTSVAREQFVRVKIGFTAAQLKVFYRLYLLMTFKRPLRS